MTKKTLDVSLVVMANGERVDVQLFLEMMAAYRTALDATQRTYEVIVVDDGVAGAFAEAAITLRKEWPAIRVIQFRRTFGESISLDMAVEKAHGRYIISSTWYLQVQPDGIGQSIAALDEGFHFVAAVRSPRCDGVLARFQSWLFNAYTRRLTSVPLHDLNCSFRAFRREVVEELRFHGDLFRFLGVLAVQRGFRVKELPLKHLREVGRSAIIHPGSYARRFLDILSLFFLIKFTNKPLRFFGLVGFAFFALGLGISLYMVYLKLVHNLGLAERPMLILGIFLIVLGVIVGSIGLIGEIIIFTQSRNLRDYHIDRIVEGGESGSGDPE